MGFTTIKNFWASEDIIKKVKRQLTEWEKIFTNHILMRDECPEYVKDSYNSTAKRQTTQF